MIESVKHFLVANWPWFVVGAVLIAEDVIARSRLRSNSTVQLVSSWLRMIPVLGRAFAVLAPKTPPSDPPVPPAALLLIVGALALAGCALSPAGRAHVALSTAAQIGEGADKAITAFDVATQEAAVQEAELLGSTTTARVKLMDWRAKRVKARAAESAYYAGLLGFQVSLQVAENAIDKKFNFAGLVDGLSKLAKELLSALSALGVPGLPSLGGL